ncbi:MAG: F0F1 ATP synthase subunit epsilon [Syntrophomonadaceae bacterium]|jgi:F-type H+-transporting ATPase subunit epsilon|nr:F0F1 ATP synthase subunit epsilon [Syntrophomonadaceae bacterium]
MADNTYLLEVVTPERVLQSKQVSFTVVPAIDGELGIMKNHAPLVAALNIGVLRYVDESGSPKKMAVSGGFIEVLDNEARVLAETAEHGHEIDVLRAKAARERAEKRLQQRAENINYARAEQALKRAIARLKAAGAYTD